MQPLRRDFTVVVLLVLALSVPEYCLAGGRQPVPTGPVLEHRGWKEKWLKSQEQASTDEEAVKATVDAYYQLKYESRRDDILYDFGFLFLTEDEAGLDTYAYERGRLQYEMAGWRIWDTQLRNYQYAPTYDELDVRNDLATVVVRPRAYVLYWDLADRSEINTEPHRLVLVRRKTCWLIQRDEYEDEMTLELPYGTDFDKLTRELPERVKRFLEEDKAKSEELRKDPRLQERYSTTPDPVPPKRDTYAWLTAYLEIRDEYARSQKLESEERQIMGAVDCYFKAKYESRVLDRAVDLDFVTDLLSQEGVDLYYYERGLLKYSLDCYRASQTIIATYTYKPVYESVRIEGNVAEVQVQPLAAITYIDLPDEVFVIGDDVHRLTLIRRADGWKIAADSYENELTHEYPPGTDFEALRRELPGRLAKANEKLPLTVQEEKTSRKDETSLPGGSYRWKQALVVCALAAFVGAMMLLSRRRVL